MTPTLLGFDILIKMTYKNIKDIIKPIAITGLASIVLLTSGCDWMFSGTFPDTKYSPSSTIEKKQDEYQFNDFGLTYTPGGSERSHIVAADFDGDGKLDIAIIDSGGNIRIYKNNMPQKGK
jgi:hypothetical protein